MQQLIDLDAEIRMLKTVTSRKIPESYRFAFLGKLDEDLFESPMTKAAYRRIHVIARDKEEIVGWQDVLEDPSINDDFQEVLRESDAKPAKTKKGVERLLINLDGYRKIRAAFNICQDTLSRIDAGEVDPEELLDEMSHGLGTARKNIQDEQKVWTTGKNSNISQLVHDTLYQPGKTLYKTGFDKFDNINGGLPTTGVFIMAATTSGGKSVTSMNLLNQMHLLNNIDVMRFSLEMDERQEMMRKMSMVSGIQLNRIKQQKLSEREKKNIIKKMKEFDKYGADNDCKYSFVTPSREMGIEDVLSYARIYNPRVLCIDYIGLLDGVDDDNQWRMLSAIARKCKVYGTENNCLVILLAQLDDKSNRLRYSQGMKEHADVCWFWNYADEETRATKQLPIQVTKMRDGELMDLPLDEAFEIMKVTNPKEGSGDGGFGKRKSKDDDDSDDDVPSKEERRKRRKGRKKDDDDESDRKSSKRKRRKRKDDDDDGGFAFS